MKYLIAVFKSRTEVMRFIEIMRYYNYYAEIISTPKEAHIGCGVSVKILYQNYNEAVKIINYNRFYSFYAFFLIEKRDGRTSTVRI